MNLKIFFKKAGFAILFIILLISSSSCLNKRILSPDASGSLRETIDMAIARVKPSLIRIHVVTVEYIEGREVKRESSGSGVIISKEGFAVTNHHVAGKAKQIFCTLSNKEEIPAKLVGTDPLADISVIKLENIKQKEFPEAKFGDSSLIKVGDYVLAMGSPLALSQSVTLGIISNTEMIMPELFWPFNKFTMDGEDVGTIIRWIGHDAAIYGGNSGGPLVNLQGEIIGINEIGMGLSGAIPGNIAKEVSEKIIASGQVERSWIGFGIQPLLKSSSIKKGVLINSIIQDSPAERAGIRAGDILLEINGKEVSVTTSEEIPIFNQLIAKLPVGKYANLLISRNGKNITFSFETIKREAFQSQVFEFKEWGMTVCNISLMMAKEMQRKNQDGVLVKNIRPGGPCGEAKPPIQNNDIITHAGNKPVKNVDDFRKIIKNILNVQTQPVPILVSFERETDQLITIVNVGLKKIDDPGLEAQKAWLPIKFQVLTKDIIKMLNLKENSGIRVTQVYPNSSAEKAGLKIGDIIISLDNMRIQANQPEDIETVRALIRQYKIGSKVKLDILRGEEKRRIEITFEPSPKLDREMKKYRNNNFDFTARDITFFDKTKEKWEENQNGVLITDVEQGGWAAISHLAVEDLLISVNGESVTSVNILENIMNKISAEKSKYVVLQILRGIHYRFIELEPDWDK